MPKICYVPKAFYGKARTVIEQANVILEEYDKQGLVLTLRQLYYQFVARDPIPNTFRSYKNVQRIVNDARLAGLIDWTALEDRTRNLQTYGSWETPADIVETCANGYRENPWKAQDYYVEVWVEKDALLGIVEQACAQWRSPYFSCRGYASQSEVWRAAVRFKLLEKPVIVLHLGDHDPSGVDMTRDIQDRMVLFGATQVTIKRIALNMPQVKRYKPPPNPTKESDSRCGTYRAEFGVKCWELDALEPNVLIKLIQSETAPYIDNDAWEEVLRSEERGRAQLSAISDKYEEIVRRFKL